MEPCEGEYLSFGIRLFLYGYEIAGAMGVRMARPEQEVYALVGDGSFLMLHSELVSSLQYDKNQHCTFR